MKKYADVLIVRTEDGCASAAFAPAHTIHVGDVVKFDKGSGACFGVVTHCAWVGDDEYLKSAIHAVTDTVEIEEAFSSHWKKEDDHAQNT